jgi:hypothetical protein
MADFGGMTFTNQIIYQALKLSGGLRQGAIPTPEDTALGINLLNQILAQWGNSKLFVFYLTNLVFQGINNQLFYFIGKGNNATISANPFVNITHVTYNVGSVTYYPEFLEKKEFDAIPYKEVNAFPAWWTYQVNLDNVQFGLYPRTTGQELITLTGQQRLDKVNLFEDASSEIPEYAVMPLAYFLAEHLANINNTVVAENFQSQKSAQYSYLVNSNQQDFQFDTRPPFSTDKFTGNRHGGWGGMR